MLRFVNDPRIGPEQLLRVGRMFEINGDAIGAAIAYREVVLAGEEVTVAEAKRRLELLAQRAWPGRPV
ncbi:MAG TPA: hypothetical protein VNY76_04755 [Candidatus Acidoferrales bacterium]|nr:hypothetical protein [Candidatus Acidoferrales bacterium]